MYHTEEPNQYGGNWNTDRSPETAAPAPAEPGSKDEVALELMKFIAVTTGYGKSDAVRGGLLRQARLASAEEHAEALMELFERCRKVVNKES